MALERRGDHSKLVHERDDTLSIALVSMLISKRFISHARLCTYAQHVTDLVCCLRDVKR